MPQVRLAISGLAECLAVVKPIVGTIVTAFAPFGIDLVPQAGIVLSEDPEDLTDGWFKLQSQLEAASHMSSPIHLVVTRAAPGHDGSIDGSLIDPSIRGVAAVYLDAYLYGPQGPAQRLDLVAQICIHELGHLFDLTHEDGTQTPTGGSFYANAILPSSYRLKQAVADAWPVAVAEAQTAGEPPFVPTGPVFYYPFNQACRSHLRSASQDPRWLPFHGPFRGDPDQPDALHDSSLKMKVKPHSNERRAMVGGGLYVTLEIHNPSNFPVELPQHIAPEHGSIWLVVKGNEGPVTNNRPERVHCSSARMVILPRGRLIRSLAFIGGVSAPLFERPGRHRCHVLLLDPHNPERAPLARASVDVQVKSGAEAGEDVTALQQLIARKSRRRGSSTPAKKYSATAFHVALLTARRISASPKRAAALKFCLDRRAPAAIRHHAALEIALEHLRSGKDWRATRKRFERLFVGPVHEELHNAFRQMRKGWIVHQEDL
jgi:hypothetical protein